MYSKMIAQSSSQVWCTPPRLKPRESLGSRAPAHRGARQASVHPPRPTVWVQALRWPQWGAPAPPEKVALGHTTQVERTVQIIHRGDPACGKVLILGQMHCNKAARPWPEGNVGVPLSQLLILQALQARQPQHVYVEGRFADMPCRALEDLRGKLYKLGAEPHLHTPSAAAFVALLLQHGAAEVYAALSEEAVHVHHTEPPQRVARHLAAWKKGPKAAAEVLFDERERYVYGLTAQQFAQEPGSTAAVIYGFGHDSSRLAASFWQDRGHNPQIRWENLSGLPMREIREVRLDGEAMRTGKPRRRLMPGFALTDPILTDPYLNRCLTALSRQT